MTIKEIAKLAEVSISTVSKVVNNKAEGINQETINRVLRIVKQYNYTPYGSMQKNLQSKTFILGVLVNQTDQSAAFIEGVTDTASTLGYGVMLFQSKGSRDQELQHITSLVANRVDALIWEPLSKQSLVYREKLQESTPVALIGKFKESQSPFSLGKSVFSKRATEELITLGHRDIVLISQGAVDQEIEDGFKQALLSHHIAYKADMISTLEEFNFDSLYNHSPTAFLSEDLKTAELLMKELRSIHIKVPYNVSIVALSQSGYPTLNAGNISTYPIPIREHGSHLAKQLIGECESNKENPTPFIGNSKLLGTGTIAEKRD